MRLHRRLMQLHKALRQRGETLVRWRWLCVALAGVGLLGTLHSRAEGSGDIRCYRCKL